MDTYDVIVCGARCAGSPTAMLLAQRGHRVLLLDRAAFPSDTLSTHLVHPYAAAALQRWGLLDALVASGCPPIHTYHFDFGPFAISGAPGDERAPVAYCPRRTVLDKILVDGAVAAGVELRERFTMRELLFEDGRVVGLSGHDHDGGSVNVRARVVVGADGRHSRAAEQVHAEKYNDRGSLLAIYYSYWRDLPAPGRFETYTLERRGFAVAETHDGLTMVVGGWPYAEFEANKSDVERHYLAMFDRVPAFAERLRGATRVERIVGAPTPNFFRKPFGPGWALVGDAGYIKDPITAFGISDAFLDAERCAAAIDASFGGRPWEDALGAYQRERDEQALPFYDLTCQVASFEPPPAEMQALLAAVAKDPAASTRFMQMNAGTITPAEFFAPESIDAIMRASAAESGPGPQPSAA